MKKQVSTKSKPLKTGTECTSLKSSLSAVDLILAEMLLPHIHGMKILRDIKWNAHTKQIGVIITTAHAHDPKTYQAAVNLGCALDFLEKPVRTCNCICPV